MIIIHVIYFAGCVIYNLLHLMHAYVLKKICLMTVELFIFCKGEENNEAPQEAAPDMLDLSPVLFEDSPSSSANCEDTGGAFEIFGTSVEEAVREMRFRIEQKTMLTASAGEGKLT